MKKVLIIVDMQNDFVTGSLGSKEAVGIVDNIVKLAESYKKEHDSIYFTQDCHGENYLDTLEGKKLPVTHCVKGTDGINIIDELKQFILSTYELNVWKKRTFGCKGLLENIRFWYPCSDGNESDIEFELCGVCTDICVVSNALAVRMVFPNSKITVRSNCCAGTSVENHNAALTVMRSCQIDVE